MAQTPWLIDHINLHLLLLFLAILWIATFQLEHEPAPGSWWIWVSRVRGCFPLAPPLVFPPSAAGLRSAGAIKGLSPLELMEHRTCALPQTHTAATDKPGNLRQRYLEIWDRGIKGVEECYSTGCELGSLIVKKRWKLCEALQWQ